MLMMFLSAIEAESYIPIFEQIYYKYESYVYDYTLGILKDSGYAEEAAQDAWVAIASNIHRIKTEDETLLLIYIKKVARNKSINVMKRVKKQFITFDMDIFESEDMNAEEILENNEDYFKLVDCIRKLPEIYVDVMTLHYIYEFSISEISTSLGISCFAVNKRLSRGKACLSEILKGVEIK